MTSDTIRFLSPTLSQPPTPKDKVLVYGAGKKGHQIARFLMENHYHVIGFADRKAQANDTILDLPVMAIDDWVSKIEISSTTLVAAIHNHLTPMNELLRTLRGYGFSRTISPIEFHTMFEGLVPDHYWLTSSKTYAGKEDDFSFLRSLLADEPSKDLLERIIRFRISGDYRYVPEPSVDDQYCPEDMPRWPDPIRFVDCGAFDGDTIRSFRNHGYSFSAIAAFEPDYSNFRRLAGTAKETPSSVCFPCTVGSKTCLQRFDASGDMAGRVSSDSDTVVQCVALDEALSGFRPTLIKMDIEGAELDALSGARSLIRESHAALAISIYHRPADLWEIPKLISSWNMGYSFYLRCHGHNTFDLVLYAVPEYGT